MPTVKVATGGIGTRAVSSKYPNEEGLELGTTNRHDSPSLEADTNLTGIGAGA